MLCFSYVLEKQFWIGIIVVISFGLSILSVSGPTTSANESFYIYDEKKRERGERMRVGSMECIAILITCNICSSRE